MSETPLFDSLTPTQRLYVAARARGQKVQDAAAAAGINRTTPATWDRDTISAAILECQAQHAKDAAAAVAALIPKALQVVEQQLDAGALDAARVVFDRAWGKPMQRREITGKDQGPIELVAAAPDYRHGLAALAPAEPDGEQPT